MALAMAVAATRRLAKNNNNIYNDSSSSIKKYLNRSERKHVEKQRNCIYSTVNVIDFTGSDDFLDILISWNCAISQF